MLPEGAVTTQRSLPEGKEQELNLRCRQSRRRRKGEGGVRGQRGGHGQKSSISKVLVGLGQH